MSYFDPPTDPRLLRESFQYQAQPDDGVGNNEYYKKVRDTNKKRLETKQGSVLKPDTSAERVQNDAINAYADVLANQERDFSKIHGLESARTQVTTLLQYVRPYTEAEVKDVTKMRKKCKEWWDDAQKSGLIASYSGTAPAAMCHLAFSDAEATFRDRTMVLTPWQIVAMQHTVAYCKASPRFGAVLLRHGTGSGKSVTLGMTAVQLAHINGSTGAIPEDEKFSVMLIVPQKETVGGGRAGDLKQRRHEACEGAMRDITDVLFPDDPVAGETTIAKFFRNVSAKTSCQANEEKGAHPFCPAAPAGGTQNRRPREEVEDDDQRRTRARRFFGPPKPTQPKPTQYANRFRDDNVFAFDRTDTEEDMRTKFQTYLENSLHLMLCLRKRPRSFVVIVDEAHVFFEEAWRMQLLQEVANSILLDLQSRVKFVFSTATPFESASSRTNFDTFIGNGGARARLTATSWLPSLFAGARTELWTISHLEEVPLGSRAARCESSLPVKPDTDLPGVLLGLKIDGVSPNFVVSDVDVTHFKNRLARLDAALNDFRKHSVSLKASNAHHAKCVILIPTVDIYIDGSGKATSSATATKTTFYQIFKNTILTKFTPRAYLTRFEDVDQWLNFYQPGVVPLAVQRAAAPLEARNKQWCVFGNTKYMNGTTAMDGAGVFGTGTSVWNLPHDQRKVQLGLDENVPPDADIIILDRGSVGVDLQGVTLEYVLGKPADSGEYRQLIGRGIRFCSLAGFPDEVVMTRVVCVGFDNSVFKRVPLADVDYVVDSELAYNKPDEVKNADQCDVDLMAGRHIVAKRSIVTRELQDIHIDIQNGKPEDEAVIKYVTGVYTAETAQDILAYMLAKNPATAEYMDILSRMLNQNVAPTPEFVSMLTNYMSGKWTRALPTPVKVNIGSFDIVKKFVQDKKYRATLLEKFKTEVWVTRKSKNAKPFEISGTTRDDYDFAWLVDTKPDLRKPGSGKWFAVDMVNRTCVEDRAKYAAWSPEDVVIIPENAVFTRALDDLKGIFSENDLNLRNFTDRPFVYPHVNDAATVFYNATKGWKRARIQKMDAVLLRISTNAPDMIALYNCVVVPNTTTIKKIVGDSTLAEEVATVGGKEHVLAFVRGHIWPTTIPNGIPTPATPFGESTFDGTNMILTAVDVEAARDRNGGIVMVDAADHPTEEMQRYPFVGGAALVEDVRGATTLMERIQRAKRAKVAVTNMKLHEAAEALVHRYIDRL